jgi:serine protease Do
MNLRLTVLILMLHAVAVPDAAHAAAETVNDARIEQELCGKGAALLKQNRAYALSNLVAQLTRRQCSLNLPACDTNRLDTVAQCDRARESVVALGGLYKCKKCTDWHVATASGFAVAEPDVFLTNYHVVEDDKAAILVARSLGGKVAAVTEVLAANRTADFALVRIPGLKLRPLPLRAGAPAGTPISVVSHPNHRFFSFTAGHVSRYYVQNRGEHMPRAEWMQVTAEFAKGSSGAPVLDECGNAVGMVASTQAVYYNEKDALSAQMVFRDCVPVHAVLNAVKPATP